MERILNRDQLISHGNIKGRTAVYEILEAGLKAGDPYNRMLQMLRLEDGVLTLGCPLYEPKGTPCPGDVSYNLDLDIDRVFVFGAGKGMLRVVRALEDVLGNYLTGGAVLVKYGDHEDLSKVEVLYGAHPVPDENCVRGCKRIMDQIEALQLTERDLVFTAIGNGIGSLMTYPEEGISLEAVQDVVHMMQIEKGVRTAELSMIRNQVDRIKGGRLTRRLYPARMVHLLAVDCNYGNTLGLGYEGLMTGNMWLHTLPDCSSKEKAIAVLKKWDAWERVDESIRRHLLSPDAGEDVLTREEFERMDCRIYGIMPDSLAPLPSAMDMAEKLGYKAHLINRGHGLEASVMGKFFGMLGKCVDKEGNPFPAPCALFYTGEMLVTVGRECGVGGRDQECALSAATVLAGNRQVVVGCVDTDGTDGPGGHICEETDVLGITTLTGGIVDGYTAQEAREQGIDIAACLKAHNTSMPLWKLGSGVWATQNISVQDLVVVLVDQPQQE